MKIEIGKTYITRDGDEVYIHAKKILFFDYPMIGEFIKCGSVQAWSEDGEFITREMNDRDLIKEKQLEIEVGKKYLTRDGHIIYINSKSIYGDRFIGETQDIVAYWNNDGSWLDEDRENKYDLIEEVKE